MDYWNYKIIQVIKKSEKAEVCFAAVEGLEKPVVVKRLFVAKSDIYRVISGIQNIHVPQIYDVKEQENELLIVEEYVDGRTLDVYFSETVLSDVQKLELMVQLCEALEVLHGCNPPVIHRDIKPNNILISEDGVLKIIDFDASRQYKGTKNTSDTRLLGTIEYAAPEQFGYAQTDFRSDIYSAGVVFSEIEIDEKAVFFKEWKRLVDKCTSFDPENRYRDVPELKKDLLKCIGKAKQPSVKKWIVPVGAVAIIIIMMLAGGLQMYREKERAATLPGAAIPAEQLTKAPATSKEPEATKGAEASEGDEVVLKEDRLVWKEEELPVSVELCEDAECRIAEVYVCEQAEENDPFSEMLSSVDRVLYEVEENGKVLQLGEIFFAQYGADEEIILYIVFDDGRGERLWLTYEETTI